MPAISVIVPMRNEAATIAVCLHSLLSQTIAASEYEVLVVDGMSEDNSAEIVRKLQGTAPNVILLKNPSRIMPAGMNIGLQRASAPVIMVAGAHTSYPSDYLEKCLQYLTKTGADVVGGPLVTSARAGGFVPRMIAAILSSRFGVGNAAFRTGLREGWVETVPYPAYRRDIFERCGGYDERLVRAQDTELHARIRHRGGLIYQTPELTTYYHPVATLQALWHKAFLDGKWQCIAAVRNAHCLSLRRFAPALMIATLIGLSALGAFFLWARIALAILFFSYFLTGLYFGSGQSRTPGLVTRVALPIYSFPFHFCYGVGTFAGLWNVLRASLHADSRRRTGPLHSNTEANRK